jgi:hypothetical protein
MDYNTEVIRTRNSLIVRWRNEAGDLWTVTKTFRLDTKVMDEVKTECHPESILDLNSARHAATLATQMDTLFTRPEDFDRVVREYGRTPPEGMPAHIREDGDAILIAIAPNEYEAPSVVSQMKERGLLDKDGNPLIP